VPRTAILGLLACALAACHSDSSTSSAQPPPPPAGCDIPQPQATTLPAQQVIELGTHAVGDHLSFNVPPGTQSISIVEQAKVAGLSVVINVNGTPTVLENSAVPEYVFFPDGGMAYNDFVFAKPDSQGNIDPSSQYIEFSQSTPIASSLTFPNTSTSLATPIAPGTWSFVVSDFAFECAPAGSCVDGGTTAGVYDVKVILHTLGSALNVNFYVVGAENTRAGVPFTAAAAVTDPNVQRMVATYKSLFSAAGITINTPRFFDVTAQQQAEFGTITVGSTGSPGPCDPIDQMFLISAANPGTAMNVFLVSAIHDQTSQGPFTVVGIDGTIPGPAGIAGTIHSGAVVSMGNLFFGNCSGGFNAATCGADAVAYIAAHETGHYLGLFHTTESDGLLFDPLTDTGKCQCAQCATSSQVAQCNTKNPPMIGPSQCIGTPSSCLGGDNLMFWAFAAGISTGVVTAEQAHVMRLNPTVQ
jgi:hypothetical protein